MWTFIDVEVTGHVFGDMACIRDVDWMLRDFEKNGGQDILIDGWGRCRNHQLEKRLDPVVMFM